ncbi:tripartite tricarboxylate transporter TctB family protein [Halomonas sp. NyZ770]|uniref:tripartite tricarboxylate transporter TctB family protein n=1 Tax=Halomonas sp. NyZ770 TaxID=2883106 RepID=UPI001D0A3615|nr:tripartite tricarboxylate transporter TctB family protein [Halomonas sp. NyZ770]UDM08591.1 tripartite tricarboxylate transporter TctB family protein [Halomonas sp. NyZ770]
MSYQVLKYRLKTIEFWTLVLLLIAGGYFLIQAMGMPFEMRRTIGPGFIPTIVLTVLIGCTLVAIIRFLTNSQHKIFTNFPEGSEDDTTFKALAEALNHQDGPRLALSSHAGLGNFSALNVINRSHPNTSILAASSKATQVNAELAAQQHLNGFKPLSLLYFDAFILAARTDTTISNDTLDELTIGFDPQLEDTVFLEKLRLSLNAQFLPMDITTQHDALSDNRIDAVLAARSEFTEALQNNDLKTLHVFDGVAIEQDALIYGDWAALFVSEQQTSDLRQQNATRLVEAVEAPIFTTQLQHVQVPWQPTSADDAQALLSALAAQGTQGVKVKARPARGRAYAIPATLLAIALFPFLMSSVGFIITSTLVTSLIMALLRAELSLFGLIKIGAINIAISVSTYMAFYHVFSIPLPLGLVW